jgi:hypothetical protein
MNMHISPAAITTTRRAARTSDLDAALKAAIDAHSAAVRLSKKRNREFSSLKVRHPDLADVRAAVTLSPTEFWEIAGLCPPFVARASAIERHRREGKRIQCLHDFCVAFGLGSSDLPPAIAERWQSIHHRIQEVTAAHRKARRASGIPQANKLDYEAIMSEKRAFEKVLRISPATRSGCRSLAKFLIKQLPRDAGGPLSHEASRKLSFSAPSPDHSEMDEWSWRRSRAYDRLAMMLRRLAE